MSSKRSKQSTTDACVFKVSNCKLWTEVGKMHYTSKVVRGGTEDNVVQKVTPQKCLSSI